MKTMIEVVGRFRVLFVIDEEGKTTVTYYRVFMADWMDSYNYLYQETYQISTLIEDKWGDKAYLLVGSEYVVPFYEIKPVFDFVEAYAKERGLWLWSY